MAELPIESHYPTTPASQDPNLAWWNLPMDERNKYLYEQYGFYQNDDPMKQMFRQYGQALYPMVGSQMNFMSQLEPYRQRMIMDQVKIGRAHV